MADILVFGGTTEGREIALRVSRPMIMAITSDYAATLLPQREDLEIIQKRMDEDDMISLVRERDIKVVVDATHPYARVVTENIRKACDITGTRLVRIKREQLNLDGCITFDDMEGITQYLIDHPDDVIFSTFGVKEAEYLIPFRDRTYLRILPSLESLAKATDLGFAPKRIICMQGPFSKKMDEAFFGETHADVLLTKESGSFGGFEAKKNAALKCGMKVLVLKRAPESGCTLDEAVRFLEEGSWSI